MNQAVLSIFPASLIRAVSPLKRIGLVFLTRLYSPLRILGIRHDRWGPARGVRMEGDSIRNCVVAWSEHWTPTSEPPEDKRLLESFGECSTPRDFLMQVETLDSAHVFGPDGSVMDREGYLIKAYSRQVGQPISAHRLLRTLRLPPAQRERGCVGVLNVHRSENYYHWLFEVLPRLHALQCSDEKTLRYYVSTQTHFQRDSLRIAGLSDHRLIEPKDHPHVLADFLLVPSRTPLGFPTPQSVRFLRKLGAQANCGTQPKLKRIYVSRQYATRRRLLNAEAVEPILAAHGFITIFCEKLSFAEQAEIFSGADYVVGIHGAGLANMAFCRPGARVLELFSPDWINLCYRSLAFSATLTYTCLVGEGGGTSPLKQGAHGRSSLIINPEKLVRSLKAFD